MEKIKPIDIDCRYKMTRKRKPPGELSSGLSLYTFCVITSNLDVTPFLCQEMIKSGFILRYSAYQEKAELYKIIYA